MKSVVTSGRQQTEDSSAQSLTMGFSARQLVEGFSSLAESTEAIKVRPTGAEQATPTAASAPVPAVSVAIEPLVLATSR